MVNLRILYLLTGVFVCASMVACQKSANNHEIVDKDSQLDLILPNFKEDKQGYIKLIYGIEEEKPTVWVVVDGTDVYCDINRNGDLTEPNECQSFADAQTAHFEDGEIAVWYYQTMMKSKYDGIVQGTLFQEGSESPKDAPVFHIAGPLKIIKKEFRNRMDSEMGDFLLYVTVGTSYPGVEQTTVRYECVPEFLVPSIEMKYPDGKVINHLLPRRC